MITCGRFHKSIQKVILHVRASRLLAIFVFLFAASLCAASDPTYNALREARPDGRSIALTNFTFDRDVYHFTLNGSLSLLAPVDGVTPGAVFVGQGEYTLTPVMPEEQRQLALEYRRRQAHRAHRQVRLRGVLRHGPAQKASGSCGRRAENRGSDGGGHECVRGLPEARAQGSHHQSAHPRSAGDARSSP